MVKTFVRRIVTMMLAVVLLLCSFAICFTVTADSAPSIRTTLTQGAVQKGSRKTFDVWARGADGKKIASAVTLNGERISHTWDDTEKTSYTLHFQKEGANIIAVSASEKGKTTTQTYTIYYQKSAAGEVIGQATWSVELFTIGCGYLVEPVKMDIREGETAAQQLIQLIHSAGYVGYYGGSPQKAFYLAYIGDGTRTNKKYNGYTNSYTLLKTPASPEKLNLSIHVPEVLDDCLRKDDAVMQYDPQDYLSSSEGYIGEFVICNGSGWMYSLNNVFPNVGLSDTYLSDGDVVRVQFTLFYGNDIGGSQAVGAGYGSEFFPAANKDQLTKLVAETTGSTDSRVQSARQQAISMLKTVNASQAQIDSALGKLRKAASQDQERTHGSDNPAASTQKTDYPAASSPQVQTHNGQPTPAHAQGPGISTQREESSAGSVNGSSSVTEQKPSALTTASGDISNTEVDDSRMQTADASEKRASDYLPAAQTRGQASKRPAQVWGRVLICIGLMLTLAAAGVGGWQFLRLRKKTLGSEERSVPDKRNGKEG